MEMNILQKEPKDSLKECLNDCSIEILEYLYEVHRSEHSKKLKTKEEYVDYLNKKIPQGFRKYLNEEIMYSAYKVLENNNENNDYNEELVLNGFMFHYHYEEPDKDCVNIIPKEIQQSFIKNFTNIEKDSYFKKIIKTYIENYLLITGYVPKSKLMEIVLNLEDINITEEEYKQIIKESNIKSYENNYTMLPKELCEMIEEYKVDHPYKCISILQLEDYVVMLHKLYEDILFILDIEEEEKRYMSIMSLSLKLCIGYQFLEKAGEEIQKEYNISDEDVEKINDLISEYKHELRFWDVNGSTNEEYQSYVFVQNGRLQRKPKKEDIKTCLKEISEEGKELIKTYLYIESNELDDIKNEILKNMDDILNDYSIKYLRILLKLDKNKYIDFIYSDLLFSGLLYVYTENDDIKVLISDEAKKRIHEIITDNENRQKLDILINRYLKENGVISIEKLINILKDYHNLSVSEETFMDIIKEQGIPVWNKYICFSSGLPDEEIEEIIIKKELFSKQHIVNLDEPDYCEDFLREVDLYVKYLSPKEREIICSYIHSMIFLGIYNKKILKETLKENHLEKHFNALNDIAYKYKNKVGIWFLNGFNKIQLEQIGKEQKIGRNDYCPCGSGLKYKKCCGK